MQKKLRLILLVLVLVLVLGGAYAGYHALRDKIGVPTAPAQISETFADCTVYDAQGEPFALSSLLGKPILLNFWATWCPYCVEEFPDLQRLYEAYGDKINFLMANYTDGARETVETAGAFIAENGYTFPVCFDKDSSALEAYLVYSFPTTVFLAPDGTVVYRQSGAMTYAAAEAQILALLGESAS